MRGLGESDGLAPPVLMSHPARMCVYILLHYPYPCTDLLIFLEFFMSPENALVREIWEAKAGVAVFRGEVPVFYSTEVPEGEVWVLSGVKIAKILAEEPEKVHE